MDHKRQHWIPQGYLKAWCDPDAPDDQEPYVWQFTADGRSSRKKAPKKIFFESELYTLNPEGGGRDLGVEHSLASLEGRFVSIREQKLFTGTALTVEEHVEVCAFMAVMHSRTPYQIDHIRSEWESVSEMGRRFQSAIDSGLRVPTSLPGTGPSLSLEQVQELATAQRGEFVWPLVRSQLPVLTRMNLSVLTTEDPVGFIKSDAPCAWFDPQAYLRPPHMQSPALAYETVEITLPTSPSQMLTLTWRLQPGRIPIEQRMLAEMNRRTRFYAQEHFIVRRNLIKPEWFIVQRPPEAG